MNGGLWNDLYGQLPIGDDRMSNEMELRAGEVAVASGQGEQSGRVMLIVPNGVSWVAMLPEQAAAVGKDMIDKAVANGADVKLVLPKKEPSMMVRTMLRNRVSLIMRSELEKGRKHDYIAESIVDIVLREVL